jgi:hypothetical protein
MKRLMKLIIWTPIALVLLLFAFANRQNATVSFDPFASGDIAAFALSAPLFVVLFLALMLGVLAGGVVTWFSQGRYRKAARLSRVDAERLRAEAQALRSEADRRTPGINPPRAA